MKVADQRQRSYGGGFVWVKKRRTRAISADRPQLTTTKPSLAVASLASVVVSSGSEVDDGDDDSSSGGDSPSQQRRVVGWDDSLCRPIYETTGDGTDLVKGSSSSGNDDDEDDGEKTNPNAYAQSKGAVEPSVERKPSKVTGTSARSSRSYGGRKRIRSGLSAAAAEVLDDASNDGPTMGGRFRKKARKDPPAATTDTSSTTQSGVSTDGKEAKADKAAAIPDQMSPQPYGNSVCSMLDSDVKTPAAISREGSGLSLDMDEQERDTNHPRKLKLRTVAESKDPTKTGRSSFSNRAAAATKGSNQLENLDFVEDSSVRQQQPSSNTSLSAAKAFFEHLDSSYQLVVNSDKSPAPRRKSCIRTRRSANVDDPKLRREYDAYRASTEESGIPPLPITDYAKHRSAFFRSSSMCDGLLDEES